jgi:uncharacterized protein with HEPN domain
MKVQRNDSVEKLIHLHNAIIEIEKYTLNINEAAFTSNSMLASAVLFQFTLIGEAVRHIEPAILSKYDYPWHKVWSFRSLISNEYFNIKMSAVWQIIVLELPKLKTVITEMLNNEY